MGWMVLDAFWRAALDGLRPRTIAWSLLPLLLSGGVLLALAAWGWSDAVAVLRAWLDAWSLGQQALDWLQALGLGDFRAVLVPLILVMLAVPVVVVICLMMVAMFATPAMVRMVRQRRYPLVDARQGLPWWRALLACAGFSLLALVAWLFTLPMWFLPLVGLLVQPLIWGWLTSRVMVIDVLADLATPEEQRQIWQAHRRPLLAMGVACGLMGAAPAAIWAVGALAFVLAPLLVLASVWLYTLVFVFSSLWFAHYLLAALTRLRADNAHGKTAPAAPFNLPELTP